MIFHFWGEYLLEKAGLKNKGHDVWSHHFMANRRGKSGNSDRFYFLGSKITTDGDCCSHEIKKCLFFGRKTMTNLNIILKSRDITLPTNVHTVKAMVFPVVIYGCESWIIKKAEHQRTYAFKLWCWRILLRVPWTTRRSNQSILKEINAEYSVEGLMLKLKLQYFGHLMQVTDSLENTLMLGKIEGKRRRGGRGQDGSMVPSTQWTWIWAYSRRQSRRRTREPGALQSTGLQQVGHDLVTARSSVIKPIRSLYFSCYFLFTDADIWYITLVPNV